MGYRVAMPGWRDRGDHIPVGEMIEKSRLQDIPNLDALVEEGVLVVVPDESDVPAPKARKTKADE